MFGYETKTRKVSVSTVINSKHMLQEILKTEKKIKYIIFHFPSGVISKLLTLVPSVRVRLVPCSLVH